MKRLPYIAWSLLGLMACQDVIDLQLPEGENLPVINGMVTTIRPVQVSVKLSAPYLEPVPLPEVSGARVLLFEDGIKVDSLVEDTVPGRYLGQWVGQIGKVYTIEVQFPSTGSFANTTWVSTSELLEATPDIDSVYSAFVTDVPFQEDGWFPFYMFKDPPGVANQYRLVKWRRDTLKDLPTDLTTFRDEFFDGISFDDNPIPAIQPEGLALDSGDTYAIEQSSLSRQFYDYLEAIREQTVNVGSTFDPPPRRIIGNIRRKGNANEFALGYFGASDVKTASWIMGQ